VVLRHEEDVGGARTSRARVGQYSRHYSYFLLFFVVAICSIFFSLSLSLLSVCVYICNSKWRIDAFANSLENFFTRERTFCFNDARQHFHFAERESGRKKGWVSSTLCLSRRPRRNQKEKRKKEKKETRRGVPALLLTRSRRFLKRKRYRIHRRRRCRRRLLRWTTVLRNSRNT